MKKLIMSVVMVMSIAAAAFAQPGHKMKGDKMKHGRHHHHRKTMALQQLNLSQTQKDQMKAATADFKLQRKILASDENQTVKQLRDKRASLAKAQKAKMESILTAEQKGKLAEMKAKAGQKRQEYATKHFEKMKQKLNLTEGQVATLKNNREAAMNKFKALRENGQLDRGAKKEQMKAMKDEMRKNFENVLTQEQKEKMEAFKMQKKNKMMENKVVK